MLSTPRPRVVFYLACLVVLVLLSTTAHAGSTRPNPLRRISHASRVAVDLVSTGKSSRKVHLAQSMASPHLTRRRPGSILPSDSIRLSLRAFEQDFYLHLQPNEDFLHPDGVTIRSYDQQGRDTLHTLNPQHVRAYHGVVVHPDWTERRWREDRARVKRDIYGPLEEGVVGRAAIILHDDGAETGSPTFEGSFSWLGNEHVVRTSQSYAALRQLHDPPISKRDLDQPSLVVHRDSDVMSPLEARAAGVAEPAAATGGCATDGQEYNFNNHLILSSSNNDNFSTSPLSFFARPQLRSRYSAGIEVASRSEVPTALVSPRHDERFDYDFDLERRSEMWRRQSGGDVLGNGATSDSYTSSIGSTSGCPSTAKVVYVGVAADCTYTATFSNTSTARTQILTDLNSVSNLYRSTYNISIGVVQLDVREPTCPSSANNDAPWNVGCDSNLALDSRLSTFSQWRGNQADDSVGLWHLLTTCNTNTEVGVAWLGTLCQTSATGSGSQIVSGTGVTAAATTRTWQVIAHEMGHNFGAIHDCDQGCSLSGQNATQSSASGGATCCPLSTSTCDANAQYIMNPSSSTNGQDVFSPCTIGNVCTLIGRGLDTSCVVDPGQRATLSPQQCGNGILEPGEECDAGTRGSDCCTTDCKLRSGAVCDPTTSACCSSSCQFASQGTVCRPAVDARCDTAETCTGNSSVCPTDVRKADGTSCASGLACAGGVCTSRDLQCQERGSSLGLSQACPSGASGSGCDVSCRDPTASNVCIHLQEQFIEGTPCGYGGRCTMSGDCKAGSWQDTFRSWYSQNLRISIPVTIVVAIIIILALLAIAKCLCINRAKRNRGKAATAADAQPTGYRPGVVSANVGTRRAPPPPPPARFSNGGPPASYPASFTRQSYPAYQPPSQPPPSNWVDPDVYNGPSRTRPNSHVL